MVPTRYTVAQTTGILLAVCMAGGLAVGSQARFTAGVNTVGVYVSVVSDNGTSPPRLSAKDFEVRDDGQLRPITLFEAGTLPITIAILLDDSPSMRASNPSARSAAAALIRRLTPEDRVTIGVFSRTVRLDGELTNDREDLTRRLRVSPPVSAGTALWDAVNAGITALEGERGRRVVLVITDGDDNSSEVPSSLVAEKAASDGILIYGIGAGGDQGRLSKALIQLARETGGSFIELRGSDSLGASFRRVVDELREQYLLGFSLEQLDGKVHRLDVRVKRRGLVARTRRSYVASMKRISADQ